MSSLEDLKPSKKKYIERDEKDKDLKKIDEIAERYLNKKIQFLKASVDASQNENPS